MTRAPCRALAANTVGLGRESVTAAFASSKAMADWDAGQRKRYAVRRLRFSLLTMDFTRMLKVEKALGTRVISKDSRSYRTLKTPKEQEAVSHPCRLRINGVLLKCGRLTFNQATYRAAPYPEILSLLSILPLGLFFVLGTSSAVL